MSDQAARAEALRALHVPGDPVVFVNCWDVASARAIAAAPGCRAVATASHAIAEALGYEDGENIPCAEMIAVVRRIAGVIELPLTADLEAGYGDAGATAAAAIEAGAVGLNLEDTDTASGRKDLVDTAAHADAVRAVRAAGESAGVPIVINARTDVYLRRRDAADAFEQTVARAAAYIAAGADSIFIPGANDEPTIRALCEAIDAPVNIGAVAGTTTVAEYAAMGVGRISIGPRAHMATLRLAGDVAAAVYSNGDFGLLNAPAG
jgi:2-methylisocitrate lyase-like PEP mutase family enzyme